MGAAAGPPGRWSATSRGATASLIAGRDLLQTHFATTSGGETVYRSDWSDVITSLGGRIERCWKS